MPILEKGDKVIVWQNPMTRAETEGVATLCKFLSAEREGRQDWMVIFDGEEECHRRRINVIDLVSKGS